MGRRSQRHKTEVHGFVGSAAPTLGAWTAGANTTLSIASGKARATRNGAGNPLISIQFSNLIVGGNYRISTTHTLGTAGLTATYSVDSAASLNSGSPYGTFTLSATGAVSISFVATAPVVYFGFVLTTTTNGQYAETSQVPTISLL